MANKSSQRIVEYNMQHITNIAMKLFFEKGIHQTTVEDIAELGDISRVTIYKYFPSKLDIILSVLHTCLEQESKYLTEHFSTDEYEKLSGYEQISFQFISLAELLLEHPFMIPFICELELTMTGDIETREKAKELFFEFSHYKNYYNAAIQKGVQDGSILKDIDERETKYRIISKVIQGIYLRLFLFHGREYFTENKQEVYDILHFVTDKVLPALYQP